MLGGRVPRGGPAGDGPWDEMRKRHPPTYASYLTLTFRLSYSVFFAAFDMSRRVGLRVKALSGGDTQSDWNNILVLDLADTRRVETTATPTGARIAHATTIVTGGIAASLAAEAAGRPFRACQRIMLQARAADVMTRHPNPIVHAYRTQGLHPFLHPDEPPPSATKPIESALMKDMRMMRIAKRVGWRLAAVGPWGFGFLVWSWVGGEV